MSASLPSQSMGSKRLAEKRQAKKKKKTTPTVKPAIPGSYTSSSSVRPRPRPRPTPLYLKKTLASGPVEGRSDSPHLDHPVDRDETAQLEADDPTRQAAAALLDLAQNHTEDMTESRNGDGNGKADGGGEGSGNEKEKEKEVIDTEEANGSRERVQRPTPEQAAGVFIPHSGILRDLTTGFFSRDRQGARKEEEEPKGARI